MSVSDVWSSTGGATRSAGRAASVNRSVGGSAWSSASRAGGARTKTLLGEAYIDLSPGTPSARKLHEGGTLPAGQVEPTQQLDQVLGAFDEPTRDALKRFLADFSRALRGRSQDLNDALGNAVPAVQEGPT
jgi:hypothetical protein